MPGQRWSSIEDGHWCLVSFVPDVVISFVKKTVAGVAGLLRLRNPLKTQCEKPRYYEESQVWFTYSFQFHTCCLFKIITSVPAICETIMLMKWSRLHAYSWFTYTGSGAQFLKVVCKSICKTAAEPNHFLLDCSPLHAFFYCSIFSNSKEQMQSIRLCFGF